ncbi:hypothetical protein [Sinomonas humi]|uniref:Uncharacterized protein n=1 Tax=Sinomonas humi TaxID=1338436 RepID=A0A0B2ANB6_9MICC|nr:hypothetical protein [Sinomonas humi]KHL05131.1 hypothetical protein LK10_02355 [Sinomonas humi]
MAAARLDPALRARWESAEGRGATGSDKEAFEIIMSASIGAGLARWDAAIRAIAQASDATA